MDSNQVMQMRGMAVRGVVLAVRDDGQAQTVDVQTHDGFIRSGIEVLQPFGHAAFAPVPGGLVVLLAMGGDEGDMVAMPVANPASRFGGLAPGESVVYGAGGSRVAIRQGGTIEVLAASAVNITAPGVTVTASSGVTIVGTVTLRGDLHVTGGIEIDGVMTGASGAAVTFNSDVNVNGSTTITTDLTVRGVAHGHYPT